MYKPTVREKLNNSYLAATYEKFKILDPPPERMVVKGLTSNPDSPIISKSPSQMSKQEFLSKFIQSKSRERLKSAAIKKIKIEEEPELITGAMVSEGTSQSPSPQVKEIVYSNFSQKTLKVT